ncbi:hypothetical protein PCYB_061030 [Plasmodium cynomolgi strain B]|uniref:Uncharacterized protein n=1 Tax=Plasmodium cynomolgi (strain B) TaxID=1120755 RepID=K6UCS7_PLACD|nr:hypothetical protein PCYB_061030 [Plasmodium cynomolgi strain B]GAB65371.1 hypothetical protein PCYB_061030 [Plasmodium cynomolgi strain B]
MATLNKNTITKEKMKVFSFCVKIFSFPVLFWILNNCSHAQSNKDVRANEYINRALAEVEVVNGQEIIKLAGPITDYEEYADFIETPKKRKAQKVVSGVVEKPRIRKKVIKRKRVIKPGSPEAKMEETKAFWNNCKHFGPTSTPHTGEHLKGLPKKYYLSELKEIEDEDDEFDIYYDPTFGVDFRCGVEGLEEFIEPFLEHNFNVEDDEV